MTIETSELTAYVRRNKDGAFRTSSRGNAVRFNSKQRFAVAYTAHAARDVASWLWSVHGIPCEAVPTA